MNQEKDAKDKEVDCMALAQKSNFGSLVSPGKEKAFFTKLNANRPTKEFWNDCATIRKNINQQSINEINKLMDREEH